MSRLLLLASVLIAVLAAGCGGGQNLSDASPAALAVAGDQVLPVKRVVLFQNGVAYLERRGTPLRPADLTEHDTIASIAAGQTLLWRFAGGARSATVQIAPRLIVNEVESVLIAARSGRGLARALSYQIAPDLEAGTLVRVMRDWEPPASPVQLVVPSGQHLQPKVRAFLDHAAGRLQQLPLIKPGS